MVLIEFRVPLPMQVDEFQVAQLFMVVRASSENTKGGEGVVWIKNEPYDNTDGHMGVSPISNTPVPRNRGQYTLKEYHLASRVPGLVRTLVPATSLILVEEAWNAYPHCKTVLVNAYLDKHKFKIDIESMHLPDNGSTHNALNLTDAELKERQVEYLDISEVYHDKAAKDYKPEYDSTVYRSAKTGRGPLAKGWAAATAPVMCCYKVCRIDFKYWGMQGKIESTIEKQQRELFGKTLSAAFCLTDDWHGLTMEDIRRLEAKSKEELKVEAAHAGEHGHGHPHADAALAAVGGASS